MSALEAIRERIEAGAPISEQDAVTLYQSTDLLQLGLLAQLSRERCGPQQCLVIPVRRICYSNICRNRCRHCGRSRSEGEVDAFTRTTQEVVDLVGDAVEAGIDQLQLTGGSDPQPPLEYYIDMVSSVRQAFPSVHIQGFAPEQLANIAREGNITFGELLAMLRAAGLDSVLEDGADIFNYEIRNYLCPAKCTGGTWMHVMTEVHDAGIRTGANMLYGHYEGPAQKAEHISLLRYMQEDTRGFVFFAPRAFRPNNGLSQDNNLVGGAEDLREFAVGRIFLHNFPRIRCYANDLGMKTTQISTYFGVDSVVVLIKDDEPVGDEARAQCGLTNAMQLRWMLARAHVSVGSGALLAV